MRKQAEVKDLLLNDIIEYCESQKYIDLKGNDVLKGGTTTMKLNTDMKLDLAWR